MSLQEFLKTQKRIKDSLFPSPVREILDTQRKLKSSLYTPAVYEFVDWRERFKPVSEIKSLEDFKPIDISFLHKYRTTFANIEGLTKSISVAENINLAMFNYDFLRFEDDVTEEESKEIETVIIEQTKSIKRIITDIYKDNSNLLKVEPRQFEEMIAELLYSKGYEVELTKQTRDNGYDIIALQMLEGNFPLKFLVECKRYTTNKVGIDIVRSFKEVVQSQNVNKGIIVASSYFTRDAKNKIKETPYLLDYRDKDDVLKWVAEYCVS